MKHKDKRQWICCKSAWNKGAKAAKNDENTILRWCDEHEEEARMNGAHLEEATSPPTGEEMLQRAYTSARAVPTLWVTSEVDDAAQEAVLRMLDYPVDPTKNDTAPNYQMKLARSMVLRYLAAARREPPVPVLDRPSVETPEGVLQAAQVVDVIDDIYTEFVDCSRSEAVFQSLFEAVDDKVDAVFEGCTAPYRSRHVASLKKAFAQRFDQEDIFISPRTLASAFRKPYVLQKGV